MINDTTVGFGQHSLASNITLLKGTEVDEIFEGKDDRFKALSMASDVNIPRYFDCCIYHCLGFLSFPC